MFPKFYTTARSGLEGYNPQITLYYDSSDSLVRTEEVWRGETWVQTISGTTWSGIFPDNWQNNIDVTKTELFSPWEEV